MGAFGEKFREERERRGFTLDDVSNVTKISSRMLQAIEQERFDVLPGGVFNKGFIRAYAKTLGFNTEEAISEYLTALRQAQLDAQNAAWDQPLPQKTALSALDLSPKAVPSTAKSSNAPEPKLPVSVDSVTPIPAISLSQEPGRSASSQSSPLQSVPLQSPGPALDEYPLPKPLVQPPSQPQSAPPPLWISPPSSSKRISPPRVPEPPSVMESTFDPPATVKEVLPAPRMSVQQESDVHEMQHEILPGPQVLIEEAPPVPISQLAAPVRAKAAPAAALQLPSTARWKTPGLILAFGVLIIVAILWMRHTRPAAVVAPPVKADSSTSAQTVAPTPISPNTPSSSSKTQPSTELNSDSDAEPTSPAVAATKVRGHAAPAKTQAPPPFRVAIRASENCWISVTADGALVSRENMIAPANTSVKASHEIVVQVSNAAAVSFRWNDRPISAPGTQAEAKTFVFDDKGMRTGLDRSADSAR